MKLSAAALHDGIDHLWESNGLALLGLLCLTALVASVVGFVLICVAAGRGRSKRPGAVLLGIGLASMVGAAWLLH